MKIISISTDNSGFYHATGAADSALLRVGEPLFLDENQEEGWQSVLAPAIRVCRMGTHIPPEFAPRYFDAITLIHLFLPQTANDDIVPPLYRDRALAPGKWLEIDSADRMQQFDIFVSSGDIDGKITPKIGITDFTLDELDIDHIISRTSKELTFRQGDIIILEDFGIPLGSPGIDFLVEGSINNHKILSFKIK